MTGSDMPEGLTPAVSGIDMVRRSSPPLQGQSVKARHRPARTGFWRTYPHVSK